MFEILTDYNKITAAKYADNLIEISIPCRGFFMPLANVSNDSASIMSVSQAREFIEKFTRLVNQVQNDIISNDMREKTRKKISKMQDINEQLIQIYSEDDDVEAELDDATDNIADAINRLKNKYDL